MLKWRNAASLRSGKSARPMRLRCLQPNRNIQFRCGEARRRHRMSSACFRSREVSGERCNCRLRLRQSAFSGQGMPVVVTGDPDTVARADRIVLPGVGAFADCRRGLDEIPGMIDALEQTVHKNGKPFFGICVGMQLMAERGREYRITPGLGWISGEVDRIAPSDPNLKIPHMGWNTLNMLTDHPVTDGIPLGPDGLHAYFVHSYQLKTARDADLIAQADYGGPVTAIVGRDNMVG